MRDMASRLQGADCPTVARRVRGGSGASLAGGVREVPAR
jgi:hypothetical protein